jgi:membrane protein YqaA with SNARE-associated domain
VRAFFFSIIGYFLTPVGVVLMGALDASLVFFLPLGIDFVVIIVSARHPSWFWVYALLAAAGSVAGAAGTYSVGRTIGERGVARFVAARRLRRVKRSVNRGAFVLASLALIPPPFPFTPFVLAAGAFEMHSWKFLGALAAVRIVRFGVEGALASRYGSRILRWTRTPTFEAIVVGFIALAVIGTIVSAVIVVRKSRER